MCFKYNFVVDARAWEQTNLEEQQEKKDMDLTIPDLK